MYDKLIALLRDPIFGIFFAAIAILIGLLANYFFYRKGQRDGVKSGKQISQQLSDAKAQTKELKKQLYQSQQLVETLVKLADISQEDLRSIRATLSAERSDDVDVQIILSKFHAIMLKSNIKEAKAYYEGIKSKVDSVVRNYMNSKILTAEERYSEAIQCLTNCVNDASEPQDFLRMRSSLYLNGLKKPEYALRDLLALAELEPDNPLNWLETGTCLISLDRLDEAITSFERVVESGQHLQTAHYNLAVAYQQSGQNEKSIAAALRSQELGGDLCDVHIVIGEALRGMKQLDDAIESFQVALENNPKSHNAFICLARAYSDNEDYFNAELTCKGLIALRLNFPVPMIYAIYLFAIGKQGRYKEVIQEWNNSPKFGYNGETVDMYGALSLAYIKVGDFANAKQTIDLILGYNPNNVGAMQLLMLYFGLGPERDFSRALAIGEQLQHLIGLDADTLGFIGFCLLGNRQYDRAIQTFNKVLEMDPGNSAAIANRSLASSQLLASRTGL